MDELFAVSTRISDFDDDSLSEIDLLDPEMMLADFADFGVTASRRPPRLGVDMPALAAAAPTTGPIVVAMPSPVAALQSRWAGLTDAQKIGVVLVASAVVVVIGGAVAGALATKAAVGSHVGHALAGAATHAALLGAAAL